MGPRENPFQQRAGETVVMLEDERAISMMMGEILRDAGYELITTNDPEEAVAIARKQSIDAFLLDVILSGRGTGLECCRQLRALPGYQRIPILMVTGLEEKDVLEEAFEAGADDFIQKPFLPHTITLRLRSHLERVRYANELQRLREEFGHYLSARTQRVAEQQARGTPITPVERDVVVLFTDVREFTALSEYVAPQVLFDSLSSELERQVEIVYEHGGYVDKFAGDGVMAVFDGDQRAANACVCALRIRDTVTKSESGSLPELTRIGIGVHLGKAVIGTLGAKRQRDYSVIGLTVNVAARLCGHAPAASIAVSDAVRQSAETDLRFRFIDEREVKIRGVQQPMRIHTLEWSR